MKYYFIIACLLFNNPNCSLRSALNSIVNQIKNPCSFFRQALSSKEKGYMSVHPITCMYILLNIGFNIPIGSELLAIVGAASALRNLLQAAKTSKPHLIMNISISLYSMLIGALDFGLLLPGPDKQSVWMNNFLRKYVLFNIIFFIVIAIYIGRQDRCRQSFLFIAKEIIKILVFYVFSYLIHVLNLPRIINSIILSTVIFLYLKHLNKENTDIYFYFLLFFVICLYIYSAINNEEIFALFYILFVFAIKFP